MRYNVCNRVTVVRQLLWRHAHRIFGMVLPSMPANTVKECIAVARAKRETLNYDCGTTSASKHRQQHSSIAVRNKKA